MTAIPYLDEMWSATTGCGDDQVSPGCLNCYARRMFGRHLWECPECGGEKYVIIDGIRERPIIDCCPRCHGTGHATFAPTFHADRLEQPLHWRKPRVVGVSFMGDLFHEAITDEQIYRVWQTVAACRRHTFLVLTKRPQRMHDWWGHWWGVEEPNLHLGVTVCNQEEADRNIPLLLDTPAAVRWVSIEPMLGAVDLLMYMPPPGPPDPPGSLRREPFLDWVVLGGESGAGARPMDPRWATQVFKDCREAGVPFWYKQPGSRLAREDKLGPTGRDWALWDEMVRTHELPAVAP